MRKIYSTGYNELDIVLNFHDVKVRARFTGGRAVQGVRATLTTSDEFLQTAIESDPRFGKLFKLDRTIKTEKEEKKATAAKASTAKAVESVRDLTDAVDYLASLGKVVKSKKQALAAAEELGITFPNFKD
jgi:hypothetical protein